MFRAGHFSRAIILTALLAGWQVGAAIAAVPTPAEDSVQMLERADKLKTADHGEFLRLLSQLDQPSPG